MSLFNELKRRNVFRVGVAYIISAWVLLQFVDLVLDNIQAPGWVMKVFMLALAIGFPLAIFFAWAFEMTPEGIKKEKDVDRSQSITPKTGRKLDFMIIAVMAAALMWFGWDKFGEKEKGSGSISPEVAQITENPTVGKLNLTPVSAKSVAVLPFVVMSNGVDDEYFADGLTEEILNSLAQLPELLVTARTSAFHFKGQDVPIQEIATALGVQHIVEGSVRRSGDRLRVTAQLIRARDGFHLWSENYDSTSKDTIAVQEDIAERIAQAMDVVMDDNKREAMRRAGLRDVEAFIAYQKGSELYNKGHDSGNQIENLLAANRYFEATMEKVPGFWGGYLLHSDLYTHLLLNDAHGEPMENISDQEIEQAYARALADFKAAAEHASSPSARALTQFSLALFEGNWRGITLFIDQYLDSKGCDQPMWIQPFGSALGYAKQLQPRFDGLLKCDPLTSLSWDAATYNTLWKGDAVAARDIALRGLEIAPGSRLANSLVGAYIANQQFEEAEMAIRKYLRSDKAVFNANILVAAARGNYAQVAQLLSAYKERPDASAFNLLNFYAWMGDRTEANHLAAKIDQHKIGYFALFIQVYSCACGAPFDLEYTPNFAARLQQSGLQWPPASPIKLPLKDW